MTPAEAGAIVELGAAAADGDPERLRGAFASAAGLVPPDHVEEYLLQTYLFAGFPRAINAFFAWRGWAASNGVPRRRAATRKTEPAGGSEEPGSPVDPEPESLAAWRERGERLCRLVYGENYEALQRRLDRLHPALAEWTLVEGYGKVLSRPGPDAGRRELAAVGSLIAIAAERQLASHLEGAWRAGVAPDLLREAIRPAAARSGREPLVARLLKESTP